MKTESVRRAELWLEGVFKALFFVYVGLGSCNLTYGKPVISWVMIAAFLTGGAALVTRVIGFRRYRSMPLLLFAGLMWLSLGLSAAANYPYFTRRMAVFLILWAFYFFLLYAQPGDRAGEDLLRRFRRLSLAHLLWTTALAAVSVVMLALRYESHYRDPQNGMYEVASGFFSGRLWGVFQDPNLGAVMCAAALAAAVYWYLRSGRRLVRGLLIADGVLLAFYMAMSDSRNGMVCLGCLGALAAVWFLKDRDRRTPAWQAALLVLGAFLAGPLLLKLIQWLYGALAGFTVDRGYDMKGDVSNRRLALWLSGFEMFRTRPLTGVSFPAVVAYAREHLPGSYIVTNDLWEFNTFDSEPINILVAQGLPGILVLLGWGLGAVRAYVRGSRTAAAGRRRELRLLTAVCAVLAVSALFQGTMFYQTSPNTYLFWCAFGTLLCLLRAEERTAI